MLDALDSHFSTLQATLGRGVTYGAGSTSVELVAVKSRPRLGRDAIQDGVTHTSRNWDWLVSAKELVNEDGEFIEPLKGHTVTDDKGKRFKVLTIPGENKAWRWSDGQEVFLRIFTEEL